MATTQSHTALLARAEWLCALGFAGEASVLLGRVPHSVHLISRFRALQLKLLAGQERWLEGQCFAHRVCSGDRLELRKAAGRFLVAHAMAQAGKVNKKSAPQLVAHAQWIWPEGKIDALALGLEYRPPPSQEHGETVIRINREQDAISYLHSKRGTLSRDRFRTNVLRWHPAGSTKEWSMVSGLLGQLRSSALPFLQRMLVKTREQWIRSNSEIVPWVKDHLSVGDAKSQAHEIIQHELQRKGRVT